MARYAITIITIAAITLATSCRLSPASTELTVLTYNTHLFEGSRAVILGVASAAFKNKFFIFDDEKRAEKMLYKIVESRADIVALQEVWADGNQVWFCRQLKSVYPYCFVSGQKEDWKDRKKTGYLNTCGLVLLSKYKFIGEPKFFEFDRSKFSETFLGVHTEEEYYARKGVITATVELRPGGPTIRLGISQTATGHDMENVDAEVIMARTTRDETGGSFIDSPAIMMGDFNVHAHWKGQFDMLKTTLSKYDAVDAYREVHPCDSEERMSEDDYTIDRQNNVLHQMFFQQSADLKLDRDRIDYVFFKKSGGGLELTPVEAEVLRDWKYEAVWKKRVNLLADLSDHYPVKVKFKLTRTTTP